MRKLEKQERGFSTEGSQQGIEIQMSGKPKLSTQKWISFPIIYFYSCLIKLRKSGVLKSLIYFMQRRYQHVFPQGRPWDQINFNKYKGMSKSKPLPPLLTVVKNNNTATQLAQLYHSQGPIYNGRVPSQGIVLITAAESRGFTPLVQTKQMLCLGHLLRLNRISDANFISLSQKGVLYFKKYREADSKKPPKPAFNQDLLPSLKKGLHKKEPSSTLRQILQEKMAPEEDLTDGGGTTAYMSNFLRLDTKLLDNELLLEKMKARDCDKNVLRYKDELAHLKYMMTMSHSNIEQKIAKMLQKEHENAQLQQTLWKSGNNTEHDQEDYRKLREYVRLYKQRLYLVPRHQIFNEQREETGLDFHTFMDIRKRHDDTLEVVKEHIKESEQLYGEVLEHSRNHSYQYAGKIYGTTKRQNQMWNSLKQGEGSGSMGKEQRRESTSKPRSSRREQSINIKEVSPEQVVKTRQTTSSPESRRKQPPGYLRPTGIMAMEYQDPDQSDFSKRLNERYESEMLARVAKQLKDKYSHPYSKSPFAIKKKLKELKLKQQSPPRTMVVEDQSITSPEVSQIQKFSPTVSMLRPCKNQHYPHEECELCGKQASIKVFHRKRVQSSLYNLSIQGDTSTMTNVMNSVISINAPIMQKSPTAANGSTLLVHEQSQHQLATKGHLSEIFTSCLKIRKQNRQFAKKLKNGVRKYGRDMSACKSIIRDTHFQNDRISMDGHENDVVQLDPALFSGISPKQMGGNNKAFFSDIIGNGSVQ